ncbi:MAG: hypothetical protein JXK93_02475 [Sphaerochaetaceae bacterium]|nr:hypothetical protein [Sphaerochaetaceae bacterium]
MEFNIRNCYLRPGFTDLRRGMNGLMQIAMGKMDLDPLGGRSVSILWAKPSDDQDAVVGWGWVLAVSEVISKAK